MPPKAAKPQFTFENIKTFARQNKRDFFFAFIALFALGGVVRMEMMKKGYVDRPRGQQLTPVVDREFGKKKKESS
ncbi:hypothetical protein AGDE_16979 [Angomonas deanei]|uniref:Uncharacterized protein n=1 Tax=Angomonas deanei TaxID=59799 RepID=A0A7G2CM37_9TRYP|nr:hypothetical protein AGDE_16979 [Angomonas deanei]CAD2219322.1 hypothetical protein, conserved [Angomonas deanei]|eukprot:EPY15761.1 hypothetical protein AGDE_16979 [Angomonas deanei]